MTAKRYEEYTNKLLEDVETKINELMERGHTKQEAMKIMEIAALTKLSGIARTGLDGGAFINIEGEISTYECL